MEENKKINLELQSVLKINNRVCCRSGVLSGGHGRMKIMQRQRGELVPVGDALSGLDGPVKAISDAPASGAAGLRPGRSGAPVGRIEL